MAEIKDFSRMCRHFYRGACSVECPMNRFVEEYGTVRNCIGVMNVYQKEADRIIDKWCKEHPQKTYAQDFLEKFPNAPSCNGIPYASACDIYRFSNDHCYKMDVDCKKCWNEVMEDS